jgi:hypothetical protein
MIVGQAGSPWRIPPQTVPSYFAGLDLHQKLRSSGSMPPVGYRLSLPSKAPAVAKPARPSSDDSPQWTNNDVPCRL